MSRVYLPKEDQYKLCLSAREKLGCNWVGLARHLGVLPHTFDNWYRGDRLLPENIFTRLVNIADFPIQNPKLLPDNWGRVKGGKVSVARHGRSFWTLKGSRKGGTNSAKRFPTPAYSEDLAEFIGIMLGDGGVSRGQISITLGYTTDWAYGQYIIKLINKVFRITPSICRELYKDAFKIRISGVNFTKNMQKLGLVVGNKIVQQFDIPIWIQEKETYIKACIRGMIDTDGCVHKKVRRERNGFEYRSIGVYFKSASPPLMQSLRLLFNYLGFKVSISGRSFYLCGKEQILRYVDEINFSNPKHKRRYQNFLKEYNWVKASSEIV